MAKTQKQDLKYWTQFCDYLSQRSNQLRLPRPRKSHFMDFWIGTGCYVRARQVISPKEVISVSFVMKGSAKTYFHSLKEQQTEIENEFGGSLSLLWEEEVHKENRVSLIKEDMDPTDETDWSNQHEWIATKFEKLIEIFRPRLEKLIHYRE